MLHIYYGRENINKDKFIFDSIKGKTLLLVPDQFTLQAERDAFFYLGARGLMDLEVVSISRLGLKILAETGGGRTALIDKYGRHMLLTKILTERKEELSIYRGLEKKQSFIEMVNNFISELKQYGTTPQELENIAQGLGESTFLRKKLRDIGLVFESYEEYIKDKYLDTEDYVSLYAEKITASEKIRDSAVWVYGFDSFTPKNTEVIGQLMRTAKEVNLVLTYGEGGRDGELFGLPGSIMGKFCRLAEEQGIPWEKSAISQDYRVGEKAPAILHLEHELYAIPVKASEEHDGITLMRAANFYSEAESAAAEVLSLVRDEGLEYKDIILICNDMETRGSIVKRVFSQYGIELFLDKKQNILHNPASVFILSLLDISSKGYRTEDVFRLLKTGLTSLAWDEIEELENYARKFRIRGSRWKKAFTRGAGEYGKEGLEQLECSRRAFVELVESFSQKFKAGGTVKERVRALYLYLAEDCGLPGKLENMIRRQEEEGYLEAAEETAQVWGLVMDVLDQFVEIVGEETILADSFGDIFRAGLESIEVGLLPPSADGLIMGTMQRTRSGPVKAMLILGANEGLLPASAPMDSILNEDEKHYLAQQEIEICKVDEIRLQEEKLAIYKNLARPGRRLWISYSASDGDGREIKPSSIFSKIQAIYPNLEVEQDLVSRGVPMELLQAENAAMEHLTAALRRTMDSGELDPGWQTAVSWYRENRDIAQLQEGIFFTNKQEDISKSFTEALYKREHPQELAVSPSRLEQYSRCPFAHFVGYGLRPEEQRIYELGGREIGDLYHTCLMEISRWLTEDGIPVNDPASKWMTVSKEECEKKIGSIVERESLLYREGILASGSEETYRTKRLREICNEISWIMIDHVRRGSIRTIAFEQAFGRGKSIPPVTVETEQGQVFIEGKIDRVDLLEDGKVKIIDYKTGNEKFSVNEAEKGFRLQLMLYLKAAQQQEREPAGVFYFLISEPSVSAESIRPEELTEKVELEAKKACKMDGVMVDDPQVIRDIAGEFSGYSDVVPVRQTQKGFSGTGAGKLMDEETFRELQKNVDEKVGELCEELLRGNIAVKPKKSGQVSACTYCKYKGICQFDLAFEGCRYEII
ncbi:exodeoxyribonuclease V subunit gamma [Anaerovorax odorimutans]|uniref:Exodeoxyribonuclease V subunit gamma n=1 Tax=Anaerovorax odorimutans TaxID=109327 RepID=A0ABT1RMU5_9FIRM|nr:PD-(D/E)XK nuclease family protein [Anaerovorax odorimutans]MCQ4636495.1 exodeoxyribonuclease V subunit gamma [Anaerovorax odorimutans]